MPIFAVTIDKKGNEDDETHLHLPQPQQRENPDQIHLHKESGSSYLRFV